MKKIFFATKNKDKIMKMINRLDGLDVQILTPYDLNIDINIEENGSSVIENASLKATAYFNKVNIPTIATDSSLYVEKLKKQPGLFVKRINKGMNLQIGTITIKRNGQIGGHKV